MTVFQIIELLAQTSSINERKAILQKNRENDLLRDVFFATKNPFYNFYLRVDKMEVLAMESGEFELNCYKLKRLIEVLHGRELTGNAARQFVENFLATLNKNDQILVGRIINRDLECNVSDGLINATWENLIPEYNCMLAAKFDDKAIKFIEKNNIQEFIIQLKADGGRANAVIRDGQITFYSRNGNVLETHGVFDDAFLSNGLFDNCMVDGELLVESEDGIEDRATGNGIFTKAVRGTIKKEEAERLVFLVWDIVAIDKFDAGFDETPYNKRLETLVEKINLSRSKMLRNILSAECSLDGVDDFYKKMIAQKQEGAILKVKNMPWEAKRSKYMMKLKEVHTGEFLVVGTTPHRKDSTLIGNLVVETACGKVKFEVGSGLNEKDREKDPSEFIGKIVELEYNGFVKSRGRDTLSAFLPVFVRVRVDKDKADTHDQLKVKQVNA